MMHIEGMAEPPEAPVPEAADSSSSSGWPAQAELVMSAIEAGQHRAAAGDATDRRGARRRPLHVKATLRLFCDTPDTAPWALYTRDVHTRGLGFITPHRLPLGYGGLIELPMPDGNLVSAACTLLRCREVAPGWYEGSLYFNRDQPAFGT